MCFFAIDNWQFDLLKVAKYFLEGEGGQLPPAPSRGDSAVAAVVYP